MYVYHLFELFMFNYSYVWVAYNDTVNTEKVVEHAGENAVREEILPNAPLFTTNPTWSVLR
jgi:hypothetical protein